MKKKGHSLIDYGLYAIIVVALGVVIFGVWQFVAGSAVYELTWSTENELDILGFRVYRAECETEQNCMPPDTAYAQITTTPIPAATDPLAGEQYRFVDDSAESRHTYAYKLETLYRDGRAELSEQPIILPKQE